MTKTRLDWGDRHSTTNSWVENEEHVVSRIRGIHEQKRTLLFAESVQVGSLNSHSQVFYSTSMI